MTFKRPIKPNRGRATTIDAEIGKRLQIHRNLKGISQEELGRALGKTFQQIQKYEKGVNRIAVSSLLTIADRLEIDPAVLYKGLNKSDASPVLPVFSNVALDVARMIDTVPSKTRHAVRRLVSALAGENDPDEGVA